MTEEQLAGSFVAEWMALDANMDITLHIRPTQAWMLMGQIQLALRHPANTGASAECVRRVARDLQEQLCASSTALWLIAERGWDAKYDVPREEGGV